MGWLVAAYLGYKSHEDQQSESVQNTRRMLETVNALGNVNIVAAG